MHPNHTDKNDLTNKTYPNEGVVVKYSANQKYTTDAVSGALVQLLAKKANVPLQLFYNRSDMAGGSTLGNISTAQVAIKSVDIGLAQLAMHSATRWQALRIRRIWRSWRRHFLPPLLRRLPTERTA